LDEIRATAEKDKANIEGAQNIQFSEEYQKGDFSHEL